MDISDARAMAVATAVAEILIVLHMDHADMRTYRTELGAVLCQFANVSYDIGVNGPDSQLFLDYVRGGWSGR